jgi:HAD superfamily hydrolase (TIGR01509 family)
MFSSKKFSNIKGIIFDCDGVLIQSKEANIKFYNYILQGLNLPSMNAEQANFVHSHTVDESIAYILPEEKLAQAFEIAKKTHYTKVLPFIKLESGLRNFLDTLKKNKFLCALNTNRTTTVNLILEHFYLENYFQPVVTASEVTWPKPHPESMHKILQVWGLKKHEAVFIGDSEVDSQAAFAAGVSFWAYQNNSLEADMHITNYWDLKLKLLDNKSNYL